MLGSLSGTHLKKMHSSPYSFPIVCQIVWFFEGKTTQLQKLLSQLSLSDRLVCWQVGYCQGTAFIVGLLLMQMPEEESFAVLVKMMKDYGMREMFKPSMTELGLCMYQLDTLIEQHMPDLHVHFQVKFNSILNCCEFNN